MSNLSNLLKLYKERLFPLPYPYKIKRALNNLRKKVRVGRGRSGSVGAGLVYRTLLLGAVLCGMSVLGFHPATQAIQTSFPLLALITTPPPPNGDPGQPAGKDGHDDEDVVDEIVDLSRENPDGKSVAPYIRVSTRGQAAGLSPKAQREELLSWAKKYRPSRLYIFADTGRSGRDFAHRKIKDITELKQRGLIDEVWVRAVDRLGRDSFELASFFVSFMLAGGVIRTSTDTFTKEPVSLINFILHAFAAEVQNNAKIEAIQGSYRKLIRDGKWPFWAPTGYIKDPAGHIHKTNDLKVRLAVESVIPIFIQTESIGKTARLVGESTGVKLCPSVMKRILSLPFYEGKMTLCGETYFDSSLAYRTEEETVITKKILDMKGAKYARKAQEIFQVQALSDLESVYELFDKLHEHYVIKGCKGHLGPNGLSQDSQPPHMILYCKTCGSGFRWPQSRQRKDAGRGLHQGSDAAV